MGMNGTIVVFPTAGSPPPNPDATARRAIAAFERLGLLLTGTADECSKPRPWIGRFAERRNEGEIPAEDYALYIVQPNRILPPLGELVYLHDSKEKPGTFELPCVEFSVIKKSFPLISGYDGNILGNTWATVEFSYEDVRYNPEIHRVRNPSHPIFVSLKDVFASPVSWGVDIG